MIVCDTIEFPPVSLSHVRYCHRERHVPVIVENGPFGEIELPIPHHTPADGFWADWVSIYDALEHSLVALICDYLCCKVDDPRTKYPSGTLHTLYGHSVLEKMILFFCHLGLEGLKF